DAIDLGVNRVLNENGLVGCVRIDPIFHWGGSVLGGLFGACPDPVPERIARRFVGDHGEGVAGVAATTTALASLRLGGAAAATCRQRKCCGPGEGGYRQAP